MMKKIALTLASGAALAALATTAFAADLPVYQQPQEAVVVSPAYDWTGLYVGALAGYGWGDAQGSNNPDGVLLGGTLGYNAQFGQFVAGLETDLAWSNLDDHDYELDYLGTVRGRLGWAFDRFMPYVTGGLAYGRTDFNHDHDTNVGWTLGGGVEAAIDQNWSVKAEYLYVDLGHVDAGDEGSSHFNAHTVKLGVNYKF